MSEIVVIKLVVCSAIILMLAEVSKRINPQLGGILSGLPLGAALSVYFISYEQGVDFAVEGVPWGLSGLSAGLLFSMAYFFMVRWIPSGFKLYSMLAASAAGLFSFLVIGLLFSRMALSLVPSLLMFICVFAISLFLINRNFDKKKLYAPPVSSSAAQILMRALMAAVILLLITETASSIGSRWALIFSSFPTTFFPLLLALHYESGPKTVQSVIQGYSFSVSTLVIFYFSYLYLVPSLGLNLGFCAVYILCIIYLYFLNRILKRQIAGKGGGPDGK